MRLVLSVQCPDLPDALAIATEQARAYSAANPDKMPKADLAEAIAISKANAATETNMFATAFCQAIIDGS